MNCCNKKFQVCVKSILNIGSCGLHVMHNAFKAGDHATDWDLESLLINLRYLFKDAPVRREMFAEVTGSQKFPYKFCSTRWLDNLPAAERAIELWPYIIKFVEHVQTLKKANIPTSKPYLYIKDLASSDMVLPRLHAYVSIAKTVTPFLTIYQTDRPMLPFLAEDIHNVLRLLMKRFIKSDIIREADTLTKLIKIDTKKESNYCVHSKIDIGFIAEAKVKELIAVGKASQRQFLDLRMNTRKFLISLVDKIIAKAPIQYSLVRNMVCLNPNELAANCDQSRAQFKRIISSLSSSNHIDDSDCDTVLNQMDEFINSVVVKTKSDFVSFNKKTDRLDTFYHKHMQCNSSFDKLWSVISNLLLLSHGQASVERGFSVNKQIEVENLANESYEAQRMIVDHIRSVGGVLKVQITKELLLSASQAYSKYKAYLEKCKADSEKSARGIKREAECDELEKLKRKKKLLEIDIESLTTSANKFIEQAERATALKDVRPLITKSVSFRKSANDKRAEINDISELIDKRQEALKGL
ncbi:uncharacterized protein LOC141911339 isoform X1 [Tubulanus polymorphus]|uniref:uncharacterized protein LOC141911339 isoform X1 n=1 Tax=Tubulanus polymorphus TaxID=672921 RepID=UPI003DA4DB4F